jgi:hypothetical protein
MLPTDMQLDRPIQIGGQDLVAAFSPDGRAWRSAQDTPKGGPVGFNLRQLFSRYSRCHRDIARSDGRDGRSLFAGGYWSVNNAAGAALEQGGERGLCHSCGIGTIMRSWG